MKKCILFLTTICLGYLSYAKDQKPMEELKPSMAQYKEQIKEVNMSVEKITTCTGIEKREPLGETNIFGKETTSVYTWTKITAKTLPSKIKHVYYVNDKKVAEVELHIKSSPFRTWSSKKVWTGNWKVEVLDENDNVIAFTEFSVGTESPETLPPVNTESTKTQ